MTNKYKDIEKDALPPCLSGSAITKIYGMGNRSKLAVERS